ncbi:MAG TPA: thiamine pyrophosphate-binding protein [Thermoanaerobaculia bacterium]|jgi:2-succinyl-5-enolpyruvyl-6-hydroxy-3-cyclohexene-1-carboxylate synthase|nr:thiamine pyrophosphate-binding protein [Thermoanaerobaculia bacterium]
MTNLEFARRTIAAIRSLGVTDFCVCAGSRNAPLLAVLGKTQQIKIYTFVDERSAAFFALGVGKRLGRPACVVTTSGTAVAELLPASIEAHYSGVPLVLLTADRPARFRGTGAQQSIDQQGIFGVHATTRIDDWNGRGALHVNVEFDEPLIDDEVEADAPWPVRMKARVTPDVTPVPIPFEKPLVLIGGLSQSTDAEDRDRVREFALGLNAPVYAEPLSGLREDEALRDLLVLNERSLSRGGFDGVIRIGNVPTLRFWRDLDRSDLGLLSFNELTFPGLSRGEVHPIEALPVGQPRTRDDAFFARDREQRARFEAILDGEPESELAIFRKLSRELPLGSRIYLGNSLPIREWDLAATREQRGYVIEANRGANGIDGQLSTAFGWNADVAIVGDLTALYDLNAPWIQSKTSVIVINNRGGRIFERVPTGAPELAINEHAISFEKWAAMFGIDVTEVRPDAEASRRVWQLYDELWA